MGGGATCAYVVGFLLVFLFVSETVKFNKTGCFVVCLCEGLFCF